MSTHLQLTRAWLLARAHGHHWAGGATRLVFAAGLLCGCGAAPGLAPMPDDLFAQECTGVYECLEMRCGDELQAAWAAADGIDDAVADDAFAAFHTCIAACSGGRLTEHETCDSEDEALRRCVAEPMRGEWHS